MTPVSKKIKSTNETVWYVRTYNKLTGKRPYVVDERGDILQFKSKEKAQDFIKSEKAKAAKNRTIVLKKKITDSQYHSIEKLVEDFLPVYEDRAPNSHERAEQYFRDYILPYFLIEKGEANLENWEDLLDDFKDHLAKAAPQKGAKAHLAKATQNHIFNVLNLFSEFAAKKRKISKAFAIERYPEKQLTKKGVEAVIPEEESKKIINHITNSWDMNEKNKQFLVFYKLLLNSGMRLSEGLGLALGDYIDSPLPAGHALFKVLQNHGFKTFGHIILEDQLNRGKRKALKSKNVGDSRIIPITDKTLAQELSELCSEAVEHWNAESIEKQYLVFYKLSTTIVNSLLTKAYTEIGLKFKSSHNLRHTFTTNLVERTFDTLLTKTITGHSSKAFERYLHIAEKMKQEAKRKPEELGYFKKKKS